MLHFFVFFIFYIFFILHVTLLFTKSLFGFYVALTLWNSLGGGGGGGGAHATQSCGEKKKIEEKVGKGNMIRNKGV